VNSVNLGGDTLFRMVCELGTRKSSPQNSSAAESTAHQERSRARGGANLMNHELFGNRTITHVVLSQPRPPWPCGSFARHRSMTSSQMLDSTFAALMRSRTKSTAAAISPARLDPHKEKSAPREPTWNHTGLGWGHVSSEIGIVFVPQMHRQSGLKPPVRIMALNEAPVRP
jgi:hypothetical protein